MSITLLDTIPFMKHALQAMLLSSLLVATGCGGSDGQGRARGITAEPGVVYENGERLFLPQQGLSFVVPDGWFGMLDDQVFHLGHEETEAYAIVFGLRISEEELKDAFEERIEIGQGVYMVPDGDLNVSGDVMSETYDITGERDGSSWSGYITATVGDFEWSAMTVGMIPSSDSDFLYTSLDGMSDSIRLFAPDEGADFTGDWEDSLTGYTFTYYYSASDYSEETVYTLCRDGSAHYSTYSYSGGITGSLSYSDSGSGSWWVENGNASAASVYFDLSNGNSGERVFSVDQDGAFYIGDYRYYREDAGC